MKLKIKLFARNIINQEVIKDFITEVSKDQNDKIKSWCNTILKNYLKNEYPFIKGITKFKKDDPEWLKIAVQNKDAQEIIITKNFKSNLLEHIFPYFKTLTGNIKHSFSEAERKTKEWDDRKSKFDIKLTKGVKELLKCNNGYTWFKITNEETLYNEGEVLQNCLRKDQHGPEYWNQIKENNIQIFTLRDNKGVGHVGVEYDINNNKIEQMFGKQNKTPIKSYHPFCLELLNFLDCNVNSRIGDSLNLVFIETKFYIISDLPRKLDMDVNLSYTRTDSLPDDLWVTGNLNLEYATLEQLPKNLRVDGDLYLSFSSIKKLPDDIKIGMSLFMEYTRIKVIPKNLKINVTLDLSRTHITKLPDNLEIGDDLILRGSKIIKLPKGLKVGGYLDLHETKITELPNDLIVEERILISENMNVNSKNKNLLKKIKQ